MTDTVTDEALMNRLKEGDMDALGLLYRRHGLMVKRAVRRFAPEISAGELDDLVQDVFLKLRRSAPHYKEQSRCRGWIFGIAVQTAQNWRRNGAVRGALLDAHNAKPVGLSLVADNSPEAAVLNRDLIEKTIRSLGEEERRLLVMYEVDGFSAREIGEMTGLSEGAVWTRLHRLRRGILDRLKQITEPGTARAASDKGRTENRSGIALAEQAGKR